MAWTRIWHAYYPTSVAKTVDDTPKAPAAGAPEGQLEFSHGIGMHTPAITPAAWLSGHSPCLVLHGTSSQNGA